MTKRHGVKDAGPAGGVEGSAGQSAGGDVAAIGDTGQEVGLTAGPASVSRSRREAIEELYENNCARAEGLIWDTKTGRELPFPPVNDALLAVREAVWWLDRELRARR